MGQPVDNGEGDVVANGHKTTTRSPFNRHAPKAKFLGRRAEQRVTNDSEAPRQPHPWDGEKFSGRNESEREVAPKSNSPGGRARSSEGEGSTVRRRPIDSTNRSGGVVSDGTRARTHRATGETLLVPTRKGGSWVGLITGSTGKEADDE